MIRCLLISTGLLMAAAPQEKPSEVELKKLEGIWEVKSAEADGRVIPNGEGCTLQITGKKTTLTIDGRKLNGTIRIDSESKPKKMDLIYDGIAIPAVYEFDGDILKICQADPGADRPTEVSGKKAGCFLTVYKRAKP